MLVLLELSPLVPGNLLGHDLRLNVQLVLLPLRLDPRKRIFLDLVQGLELLHNPHAVLLPVLQLHGLGKLLLGDLLVPALDHLLHQLVPGVLLGLPHRLDLCPLLLLGLRDENVPLRLVLVLLLHLDLEVLAILPGVVPLPLRDLLLLPLLFLGLGNGLLHNAPVLLPLLLQLDLRLLLLHSVEGPELLAQRLVLVVLHELLLLLLLGLLSPARLERRDLLLPDLLHIVALLGPLLDLLVQNELQLLVHLHPKLVILLFLLFLLGPGLLRVQVKDRVLLLLCLLLDALLQQLLLLNLHDVHQQLLGLEVPEGVAALLPLLHDQLARQLLPLQLPGLGEFPRLLRTHLAVLGRVHPLRVELLLQGDLLGLQHVPQPALPTLELGLRPGHDNLVALADLVLLDVRVGLLLPQSKLAALLIVFNDVLHILEVVLIVPELDDSRIRRNVVLLRGTRRWMAWLATKARNGTSPSKDRVGGHGCGDRAQSAVVR